MDVDTVNMLKVITLWSRHLKALKKKKRKKKAYLVACSQVD